MKVLITGGSGVIGQALCNNLLKDGHTPLVLSRSPVKAKKSLPIEAMVRECADDFLDESPRAIVNLAGEPIAEGRWTESKKKVLLESRIRATRDIVDFCRTADTKPKSIVSASAVGYYGDQGDKDVTEQTEPRDEFAHQLCKRWEDEAREAEKHGVRVAIVRIDLVLDAGGGML